MKLTALSLIALLLAGCACKPIIVKEPVEVKVPVPVPCVAEVPAKPQWELDKYLKSGTLFERGNAALIEIEQRREYEAQLEAVVLHCKQP